MAHPLATQNLFSLLMSAYPFKEWSTLPFEHAGNKQYAIAFTHDGICITDPCTSSCSRFDEPGRYGLSEEHAQNMRQHNLTYQQVEMGMTYDFEHMFNIVKEGIQTCPRVKASDYLTSLDFIEVNKDGAFKYYYLNAIDGSRILVSDGTGTNLPEHMGGAVVGQYDAKGTLVNKFNCTHHDLISVIEKVKMAKELHPELDAGHVLKNDLPFVAFQEGPDDWCYILENPDGSKIVIYDDTGYAMPITIKDADILLFDVEGKEVDIDKLLESRQAAKMMAIDPSPLDPETELLRFAIPGSLENNHAVQSLILWLSDNVEQESDITFSNSEEVVVKSEQALIALKALLPQFAHLNA